MGAEVRGANEWGGKDPGEERARSGAEGRNRNWWRKKGGQAGESSASRCPWPLNLPVSLPSTSPPFQAPCPSPPQDDANGYVDQRLKQAQFDGWREALEAKVPAHGKRRLL